MLADLITDDLHINDQIIENAGTSSVYVNTYLWSDAIFSKSENDITYNETYKAILQANIVINDINLAVEGSNERKAIVLAQAKFHRAYYYTQLVGIYGWDYKKTQALSDLAVPLVLVPSSNHTPARGTVHEVYSYIINELNDVLNEKQLPNFGVDILHPGKASAHALLARVYLMMSNFELALSHAQAALDLKDTLQDYRKMSFKNQNNPELGVNGKLISIVDQQNNPELYIAKVGYDVQFFGLHNQNLQLSKSLLDVFLKEPKDLRLAYNTVYKATTGKATLPTYTNRGITTNPFNYSLGVPEMLLIKAECLARKNRDQEAIEVLNHLRQFRFKTSDYVELIPEGDVVERVLEERRRELYAKGGLRLFDLKRLNSEGKYKVVIQRYNDDSTELYNSLQPFSPRYLMPFSPVVIANNNLIIQNER
ncbi:MULTISPECIES: RagB/SusD family nutrient uptake outer membrane protein [Sphingobacterium]|uniref:RagB/SusD family nutrient uptake outer membrane protein n=1 Tax=Sphingobacterium TaxID=28453 RepID=UPI0013DB3D1D|nr:MULTISPECIES: RagB/SusD family nutrient uptake outer membrane protein [unclassified Sphingobacterium]